VNQQTVLTFKPEDKEDMPGDDSLNHLKDLLVTFLFFEENGQHVYLPHLIAPVHVERFGCECMASDNLFNIIDHGSFYDGSHRGMGVKSLFRQPEAFVGG